MSALRQLCGVTAFYHTRVHRYIDPIDFVNSLSLKHNEQQVFGVCNIPDVILYFRMHKSLEIFFLAG